MLLGGCPTKTTAWDSQGPVVSSPLSCPRQTQSVSWVSKAHATHNSSCCQVTTTAAEQPHGENLPENHHVASKCPCCGIGRVILVSCVGNQLDQSHSTLMHCCCCCFLTGVGTFERHLARASHQPRYPLHVVAAAQRETKACCHCRTDGVSGMEEGPHRNEPNIQRYITPRC